MSDIEVARILAAIAESRAETKADLAGVTADVAALKTDVAALKTDVAALKTDVGALKTDVGALKTDVGALKTDFAVVNKRLDAVDARLDRQGEWQTQIRVDLMDRMDRIQYDVRLLRDDITVNFAASERTERLARGATDETRLMAEQLSGMRRQIHNLQTEVRALRGEG